MKVYEYHTIPSPQCWHDVNVRIFGQFMLTQSLTLSAILKLLNVRLSQPVLKSIYRVRQLMVKCEADQTCDEVLSI